MTVAPTRAVLVIGAPGAGKTTLWERLCNALTDDDVRHAAFEAEALALSHPALLSDRAFAHIRALAASFREAGFGLLIATATVESQWWCEGVCDALGVGSVLVVRCDARPETLERRLREREPADWSGLERLIRASGPLAATAAKLDVDLAIDTEATGLDDAVALVREAAAI